MELPFAVGILGSVFLVVGSALPARTVQHPVFSLKNWLFAVGNVCMFGYSILNYVQGGSFFFVVLQVLIAMTTVLMMINTSNRFDVPFVTIVATGLVAYSLYLFEGMQTVLFVIGLSILGLGFALDTGTYNRNVALGVGSGVIAVFSYIEVDWVFFGLNFFFAVFSFFNAWKLKTA